MKHLTSRPSIIRVPNARTSVSASSRVRKRDRPTDPVPTVTELWPEISPMTSNAQRVARYLVHAPWRLNTCSAVHSDEMLHGPLPRTSAAVIAAADEHDRTAGLTKCTRARFPTGHLNVGSGCLTGMNTLNIVSSWYTTPVAPLVAVMCFQVLHTSTLRYSETSLCLIPCLRPELIGAECRDVHAG